MSDPWKTYGGAIATGGSVLSIRAGARGQTWLATGGGTIVTDASGGWRPLPEPLPMEQAGLVGAASTDWWVAGLSGGLILTWDGGQSWASAWIDQVSEPITCLAVSPRYESDITLLAGTAGAGVLRSADGGRRWQLSNFGLEEFTILALATAGDWSRRQVVFAGTADGVYRSSGGGRAWKSVGLKGMTVQSLAVGQKPSITTPGDPRGRGLPDASGAWTILAGTEANGLYRAQDGGFTWERCGNEVGGDAGINALLCVETADGEVWLAGTDQGYIWRSADNGYSWSLVCSAEGGPVLALAEARIGLLAGTSEQGLWASTDLGLTWRQDDTLCAWGFRRLYLVGPGGQQLAALAPSGGVWISADAGQNWARALEASLYEPVLAYMTEGETWLAARADGLWRGAPGKEPALVLESGDTPIVALASHLVPWPGRPEARTRPGTLWAGAADAALWASDDEGASWRTLDVPFRGHRLLGLAFSPEDGTPLVGTFAEQNKEAALWRHADGRWQCWLSRSDTWAGLALAADGARGEGSWVALGGKPYAHTPAGWREVEISGHDGGVSAITGANRLGSRYLICASEVLCQDASGEWRTLPLPEDGDAPVDLCMMPSGVVFCLDAAGAVWRLES